MACEEIKDLLISKIETEGWTHAHMSTYLQELYPGKRGFSIRSIQRFCSENGIHRTQRLPSSVVDSIVTEAVRMVRPH